MCPSVARALPPDLSATPGTPALGYANRATTLRPGRIAACTQLSVSRTITTRLLSSSILTCAVNVLHPTYRKLKPYCIGIVVLAKIWFSVLSVQPHLKSFACIVDLPLRCADARQAHTAAKSFQLGHGEISFIHYRIPREQSWNRVLSLKVHRNNLPKR